MFILIPLAALAVATVALDVTLYALRCRLTDRTRAELARK